MHVITIEVWNHHTNESSGVYHVYQPQVDLSPHAELRAYESIIDWRSAAPGNHKAYTRVIKLDEVCHNALRVAVE